MFACLFDVPIIPARSNTTLVHLLTVTFNFRQAYCAHERSSTTFAQYVLVEASEVAKHKDSDAVPGAQFFQEHTPYVRIADKRSLADAT